MVDAMVWWDVDQSGVFLEKEQMFNIIAERILPVSLGRIMRAAGLDAPDQYWEYLQGAIRRRMLAHFSQDKDAVSATTEEIARRAKEIADFCKVTFDSTPILTYFYTKNMRISLYAFSEDACLAVSFGMKDVSEDQVLRLLWAFYHDTLCETVRIGKVDLPPGAAFAVFLLAARIKNKTGKDLQEAIILAESCVGALLKPDSTE